jgi:hypothetical protein
MTTLQTIQHQIDAARANALIAATFVEIDRIHAYRTNEAEHLSLDDSIALSCRAADLREIANALLLEVAVHGAPQGTGWFWNLFDALHNTPKEVTL